MRLKIYYRAIEVISKLEAIEFNELLKQINISGNKNSSKLRYKISIHLRERGANYDKFLTLFKDFSQRKLNEELGIILKVSRDAIIQSRVLEKTLSESMFFKEKFRLLKEIPYIMMVRKNGSISESKKLIEENIEVAIKYELLDELMLYLQMKLDITYFSGNQVEIEKLINLIRNYEKANNSLRFSVNLYEKYMSEALTKSNADLRSYSDYVVNEIRRKNRKLKSNRISLYLFLMEMERSLVYHDYNKGYEYGCKLIELLKNESHLYSEKRLGMTLSYLSHNQLCSLEFVDAIKLAETSFNFLNKNSILYISTFDFVVKANIFRGLLSDVLEQLNTIFSLPSISSFPFYNSKFQYYQAIVFFLEGKFDDCWRILSRHLELEKDKEGWRVWLSIMRIICQIEREEYVEVDMQIQSFRKYIKRWEEKSEIRERDKLVFSVLESLNRNHFDYKKVAEVEEEQLTVLAYPKGDLKWEPNSPELVLFHEWFRSKLESKPYEPHFEPYRVKKSNHKPDKYLSDIQRVKEF